MALPAQAADLESHAMSAPLVYPDPTRSARQRIGGALYLGLGAIFLIIAFAGGDTGDPDGFWLFAAAIGLIVGMALSGYRHEVRIDRGTGLIRAYTGFFFVGKHRRHSFGDFQGVEVRKRTRETRRFSNFSGRTYEPALEVSYRVYLQGRRPLEVETTGVRGQADAWAREVGAAMSLPITFIDEDEMDKAGQARERKLRQWIGWLTLVGGLAAFGWIVYNLMQFL